MAELSDPVLREHDGILVVRDDLVPGGTKRRVLPRLLTGAREFVYASPVYGYAQIALAEAAQAAGKRATVFCAARQDRHERTRRAAASVAKIVEVSPGYLSVVQARARSYASVAGAVLLPFGLDTPAFRAALADVARALPVSPAEVWTVAGSGVLTRALQAAWPDAIFHAVCVGARCDTGRAVRHLAPERFEDDARGPRPPFPSCSNYDAKAWAFVRAHASPGALFWNVAA